MGKIMVYGGCVTRDAVEQFPHELLAYVARQSLISGMAPPGKPPAQIGLASAFQRRAVEDDFRSSLRTTVARHAEEIDLLLMDILAERFGVYRVLGGRFVTRSSELTEAKIESRIPGRRELERFGTDTHFRYWSTAAKRFERLVSSHGLKERVVVIETPWAKANEVGECTAKAVGMLADEANTKYQRYYDLLRTLGFAVHCIPDDLVIASSSHKWGEAPFHYVDAVYDWLGSCLARLHPARP